MRNLFVLGMLLLLQTTMVSAYAELHQTFVTADDGNFYGHTSIDPDGQENLRVTWLIPELDFRYRAGPYEDDDDFSVNTYEPFDVPAGEYLVRVTLSNDEGRKVVYRYVTVE